MVQTALADHRVAEIFFSNSAPSLDMHFDLSSLGTDFAKISFDRITVDAAPSVMTTVLVCATRVLPLRGKIP
jgi:hypothetical protein